MVDIADVAMAVNHRDDSPAWLRGDLNGNGKLDALDLSVSVNRLLGRDAPPADAIGFFQATPLAWTVMARSVSLSVTVFFLPARIHLPEE